VVPASYFRCIRLGDTGPFGHDRQAGFRLGLDLSEGWRTRRSTTFLQLLGVYSHGKFGPARTGLIADRSGEIREETRWCCRCAEAWVVKGGKHAHRIPPEQPQGGGGGTGFERNAR